MAMEIHTRKRGNGLNLIKRSITNIMRSDGLRVAGRIVHGWDRELVSFTTTLHVPASASQPRHKALLLAATFLMEYTHFERAKSTCMRCNCF
ncbi:unnamed protein product [Plutella xylostella]|uniref:(diamondback moth) hypothetical protein n=1 Tax=Plutella xylostella TaxID=51655 RepID=A0A8S4GAH3_PLUXY|nr:unnamed protein product [Plutella xylostella]